MNELVLQIPLLITPNTNFPTISPEYVNGGEMFTHLNQRERFQESEARVYIAEVTLALEHLHNVRTGSQWVRNGVDAILGIYALSKHYLAISWVKYPSESILKQINMLRYQNCVVFYPADESRGHISIYMSIPCSTLFYRCKL